MSFLLRSCSNQKAKQAQQRISTQQKIKQDKKEESTEKADTKKEEEKEITPKTKNSTNNLFFINNLL
mgnify:CR=1 FL=1